MKALPHCYQVTAAGNSKDTSIDLNAHGLPCLKTAAPAEFGGPGDLWSPETMLTGAVANCFILTFKAIARASKLDWLELSCRVKGELERVDKLTKFTRFEITTHLKLPAGSSLDIGKKLLEKAEQNCLITASLTADVVLVIEVSEG